MDPDSTAPLSTSGLLSELEWNSAEHFHWWMYRGAPPNSACPMRENLCCRDGGGLRAEFHQCRCSPTLVIFCWRAGGGLEAELHQCQCSPTLVIFCWRVGGGLQADIHPCYRGQTVVFLIEDLGRGTRGFTLLPNIDGGSGAEFRSESTTAGAPYVERILKAGRWGTPGGVPLSEF